MRRLPAAVIAVAVIGLLAPAGQAAPHGFTDPRGDTLVQDQPGLDIVAVRVDTAGVKQRGRYVPVDLVVTIDVAGAIVQQPGVAYEVTASSTSCNSLEFTYSSGTVYGRTVSEGRFSIGCDGNPIVPAAATVDKGRLVMRVPLRDLPRQFDEHAAVLSDFRAMTEVRDPMFAIVSAHMFSEIYGVQSAMDLATSNRRWRIS